MRFHANATRYIVPPIPEYVYLYNTRVCSRHRPRSPLLLGLLRSCVPGGSGFTGVVLGVRIPYRRAVIYVVNYCVSDDIFFFFYTNAFLRRISLFASNVDSISSRIRYEWNVNKTITVVFSPNLSQKRFENPPLCAVVTEHAKRFFATVRYFNTTVALRKRKNDDAYNIIIWKRIVVVFFSDPYVFQSIFFFYFIYKLYVLW